MNSNNVIQTLKHTRIKLSMLLIFWNEAKQSPCLESNNVSTYGVPEITQKRWISKLIIVLYTWAKEIKEKGNFCNSQHLNVR